MSGTVIPSIGEGANTSILLQPMPIPRTVGAPLFDGKYVRDFISILERHGEIAGLSRDDLPVQVLQYCTDNVKKVIRWCDEFEGREWTKAKELLLDLYGSSDEPSNITIDNLRDFVKESRNRREFSKRIDIDKYHQGFLTIAGPLKKKGELKEDEMRLKFLAGLPVATRAFVTTRLPAENKEVRNPPSVAAIIKIVCSRFDPKNIESYGYESEDEEDVDGTNLPDRNTQAPHVTILPPSAIVSEPPRVPQISNPSNQSQRATGTRADIDSLAQQLQQLSLNHSQILNALATLNTRATNSQPANGDKRCFICGQIGTHRLHPRHCPETPRLMAEGLVVFLPDRQRYALPDGSDLPVVPADMGGVAKYLREIAASRSAQNSNRGPTMAKTSAGQLYIGNVHPIEGDVIGIDAEDYVELVTGAVTRTGRDTANRTDPYKRPEKGKSRECIPASILRKPAAPTPQMGTYNNTTPSTQVKETVVPTEPIHPINTEEGWKELTRKKKETRDEEMKDARMDAKPRSSPQYYFTSDIQEQVNQEDVLKQIFNQTVSLSLKDIIGISPILQKKFNEVTKTRREYSTKNGEYELYSPQVEEQLRHTRQDYTRDATRTLFVPDANEFQTFLVRHSNAVQLRPTKLLAMTTGTFIAKMCGKSVKFMIDTGSELNLIPERILTLPGLALDFEGSRWALKGVNGAPVGLKGCCMDVPVQIGQHMFDHHFFVSREDMRGHDVILGQPWIQWYAARIDYDREGTMKMMVWHDGNRSNQPTLQLQLTIPDDPRNVATFRRHTHYAEVNQEAAEGKLYRSSIEEVEDEEASYPHF